MKKLQKQSQKKQRRWGLATRLEYRRIGSDKKKK